MVTIRNGRGRRGTGTLCVAAVLVATTIIGIAPMPAGAAAPPPRDTADACPSGLEEDQFNDVSTSNVHGTAIDCIVAYAITNGTAPGEYSPSDPVTRAQIASFMARAIERTGGTLPSSAPDAFDDDEGSVHEPSINRLAAAGIISGTGPRRFSPSQIIARDQMATVIARTYEERGGAPLPAAPEDYFGDDNGNAHENNINRLAFQGIVGGVTASNYNPSGSVQRDSMASFIARMLDLLAEDGVISPPSQSVYLGSCNNEGLPSVQGGGGWSCEQRSIDGTLYVRTLDINIADSSGTRFIEFDLSRDFSTFSSTIGLDDASEAGLEVLFEVYADGVRLFERTVGLGTAVPVNVDVTDVLRLRLQVTPIEVTGDTLAGDTVFAEPIVTS